MGDTVQYDSADVPKSIPDIGSVDSALAIPDAGATDDIDVRLDVSHPFDSDLLIELISPAGTSVVLADSVGMWGDNFIGTIFDDEAQNSVISVLPPFVGRLRPGDQLSDLDGTDRAGPWVLRVTDQRGDYTGSITGWGLDITKCSATASSIGQASRLAAVDQLPPRCGDVGAPKVPKLPPAVLSGEEEIRGTLITVTTNSDATDGDVSSVEALIANPGADGAISLREAIEATNNDPGEYTIRFGSELTGFTIRVRDELFLTGGGVFVDGDMDSDGRPDVTLLNRPEGNFGFVIASSPNRLHALTLRDFSIGVLFSPDQFDPPLTGQTFSNNSVTGLVLDVQGQGVLLASGGRVVHESHNRWFDTRFIGNTAESGGIGVGLHEVIGDVAERIIIANNAVSGISLNAGAEAGSRDNRITDAVVAYNSVDGTSEFAISMLSSFNGATENVLKDIRITGNHITWVR